MAIRDARRQTGPVTDDTVTVSHFSQSRREFLLFHNEEEENGEGAKVYVRCHTPARGEPSSPELCGSPAQTRSSKPLICRIFIPRLTALTASSHVNIIVMRTETWTWTFWTAPTTNNHKHIQKNPQELQVFDWEAAVFLVSSHLCLFVPQFVKDTKTEVIFFSTPAALQWLRLVTHLTSLLPVNQHVGKRTKTR